AATQVFTSEGSGTFGVNQALAAYYRFGCENSILYTETDEELFPTLISNMQSALPAHFAIVDEAWSSGHNIVVDGYNTDNYFHVNFGWGGTYNGWYLLPDEMPYGLTVIEGVVVDIMKDDASDFTQIEKSNQISIYPNPANEKFNINNCLDNSELHIFDLTGRLICSQKIYGEDDEVETSSLTDGIYIVSVQNENEQVYSTKLQIIK
ncbi:MAG: T9SS type A sorting domain-containing protein, partial [Sphingobacteriia bacterium]|nr:T9SS type A sorting domain-containing protein [Sphingobacteriia bacterium]